MEVSILESLIFRRYCRVSKRTLDVLIAVPSLVLFIPLMLLIAVIVRLDSAGNPLFRQVRIGRNRKYFTMYKFRTLYLEHFGLFTDQEEPHAYRITRVGKFLRRSKLDELPQLINVIIGNMSIVGPRPDLPLHLASYTHAQFDRFLVKPGLTGLAQVSGNTVLSWPSRKLLDLWYISNWTFIMDIQIIAFTFIGVFKGQSMNDDPFNLHGEVLYQNEVSAS